MGSEVPAVGAGRQSGQRGPGGVVAIPSEGRGGGTIRHSPVRPLGDSRSLLKSPYRKHRRKGAGHGGGGT